MQISTRHTYHADPQSVVEMMANEVWLTAVARAAGAERWQVSADIAGSRVLAEVPAGALADRWSRRGVLVCGAVLQAAAFALWAAATATASCACTCRRAPRWPP